MDDHDPDYDCNDSPCLKVATGLSDIDQDAAKEYWTKLRRTLRDVFHERGAQAMVGAYQERLRNAGPEAELLAYHLDPLQVAADLAGNAVVTLEQKVAYLKILKHFRAPHDDLPDESALNYGFSDDSEVRPARH